MIIQGVFLTLGLPLEYQSTEKLIWARLGVSRTIYVNVESPNLGFPYFLGEAQCKKTPCMIVTQRKYYTPPQKLLDLYP